MTQAIELVLFKQKDGVTNDQLESAALAISPTLKGMKSFVSREFARAEDGRWADIVHWTDLESAKAAADAVMQLDVCKRFFEMIDKQTMDFMHLQPVT